MHHLSLVPLGFWVLTLWNCHASMCDVRRECHQQHSPHLTQMFLIHSSLAQHYLGILDMYFNSTHFPRKNQTSSVMCICISIFHFELEMLRGRYLTQTQFWNLKEHYKLRMLGYAVAMRSTIPHFRGPMQIMCLFEFIRSRSATA